MSNVIHLLTRERIGPSGRAHECEPATGECLACFVHRMVMRCECTGTLVWAEYWKRVRAPRASALIDRLERQGALCDCSLTHVVWSPAWQLWHASPVAAPAALTGRGGLAGLAGASPAPECLGVRRRATRPCALWSSAPQVTG